MIQELCGEETKDLLQIGDVEPKVFNSLAEFTTQRKRALSFKLSQVNKAAQDKLSGPARDLLRATQNVVGVRGSGGDLRVESTRGISSCSSKVHPIHRKSVHPFLIPNRGKSALSKLSEAASTKLSQTGVTRNIKRNKSLGRVGAKEGDVTLVASLSFDNRDLKCSMVNVHAANKPRLPLKMGEISKVVEPVS
jgi:hypothetical protein